MSEPKPLVSLNKSGTDLLSSEHGHGIESRRSGTFLFIAPMEHVIWFWKWVLVCHELIDEMIDVIDELSMKWLTLWVVPCWRYVLWPCWPLFIIALLAVIYYDLVGRPSIALPVIAWGVRRSLAFSLGYLRRNTLTIVPGIGRDVYFWLGSSRTPGIKCITIHSLGVSIDDTWLPTC